MDLLVATDTGMDLLYMELPGMKVDACVPVVCLPRRPARSRRLTLTHSVPRQLSATRR
jgi:hypothetical protein